MLSLNRTGRLGRQLSSAILGEDRRQITSSIRQICRNVPVLKTPQGADPSRTVWMDDKLMDQAGLTTFRLSTVDLPDKDRVAMWRDHCCRVVMKLDKLRV